MSLHDRLLYTAGALIAVYILAGEFELEKKVQKYSPFNHAMNQIAEAMRR